MKAEERHELKENDLASWLQYGLPLWLKNNGSYVILVLALAFLGYQLYRMYNIRQENARAAAWTELQDVDISKVDSAESTLQGIIDKTDMPKLKEQALFKLADFYHSLVTPEQRTAANISTRKEALDKAYETYEKILNQYGDDLLVSGYAIFGMATIEEDRDPPAFDKAKALYERLTDPKGKYAGTDAAGLAMLRLAHLDDRKNAPRLFSMLPPWPKVTTSQPSLGPSGLGGLGGLNGIPGLGGTGTGSGGLGTGGLPGGLGGLGIPGLGGTTQPGTGTTLPGTTLPSLDIGPILPGGGGGQSSTSAPATGPK